MFYILFAMECSWYFYCFLYGRPLLMLVNIAHTSLTSLLYIGLLATRKNDSFSVLSVQFSSQFLSIKFQELRYPAPKSPLCRRHLESHPLSLLFEPVACPSLMGSFTSSRPHLWVRLTTRPQTRCTVDKKDNDHVLTSSQIALTFKSRVASVMTISHIDLPTPRAARGKMQKGVVATVGFQKGKVEWQWHGGLVSWPFPDSTDGLRLLRQKKTPIKG
ncbi:hypothetical protein F5148DRAFT_742800 [Russula earlei]|uniref:Uncharacterized protein n=1 Tax=Russula earlei TaxID=71964 RepID=A0ACC0UEP4_9AGAM|nr:hypothetical protein F5148DRAFT_742800 [Russula earlei]